MDSDSKQVKKVKKVKFDRTKDQRAAIKPSDLGSSTTQTPKPTAVPKPMATSTSTSTQSSSSASGSTVMTIEQFINAYLKGSSLRQTVYGSNVSKKLNAARTNFRIPSNEEIYLILDTYPLGTCKTGLALGSKGIYFVDDRGNNGGIAWSSLKSLKLACSNTVFAIGNYQFTSRDSVAIAKLLAEIQSRLS